MKPLTFAVIATTVFLTLTAACTHNSKEPAITMENMHPQGAMQESPSIGGAMEDSHDGMTMDKPMMETTAEPR
nr:hypothetical protein [uncultured Desulfobulbus sp.]